MFNSDSNLKEVYDKWNSTIDHKRKGSSFHQNMANVYYMCFYDPETNQAAKEQMITAIIAHRESESMYGHEIGLYFTKLYHRLKKEGAI